MFIAFSFEKETIVLLLFILGKLKLNLPVD